MKPGCFFSFNSLYKKVENVISIFDYTDLPAKDSCIFSISVAITNNSVRFYLHNDANKDVKGNTPWVIMELPYTNDATNNLSSTIQNIYNSYPKYPKSNDATPQDSNDIVINNSCGGIDLEKVIKAHNSLIKMKGENTPKADGEKSKDVNQSPSFSTLWLMDIDNKGCIRLLEDDSNVVIFLRKLFLDFMFDLKHSDVFQNSIYYQQMYSGLMSDFFFSALMHKCEYYYLRIMTRKAIVAAKNKKEDISNKALQSITTFPAKELFQAESLWMEDIMSPQAEVFFVKNHPKDYYKLRGMLKKMKNSFLGTNQFESWPSWFAEPEEEMKRVCFKTEEYRKTEDNQKESVVPHICNSDTLVDLLQLEKNDDPKSIDMVMLRNLSREKASQWFLKRYDFNDVLHLHFFRGSNTISSFLQVLILSWIIYMPSNVSWSELSVWIKIVIFVVLLILLRTVLRLWKTVKQEKDDEWGELVAARNRIVIKRLSFLIISTCIAGVAGYIVLSKLFPVGWGFILIGLVFFIFLFLWNYYCSKFFNLPKFDFVAKLHLLLPRAVASITLAWFTLSAGFDLYASFFDSMPSWRHAILISVIVFLFIMYEINRITPSIPTWKKVLRSLESLIISYTISLIVGFFIIDFLGAKYMERSDVLNNFYTEYVNNPNNGGLIMEKVTEDTTTMSGKVYNLVNVCHLKDNNEKLPIAAVWGPFEKGLQFFILPNFLIMFSFIAMFIGIFIQLIILGDSRQITEF